MISKAWACLRTSTAVRRSDATTNGDARRMAWSRCIVGSPARSTSRPVEMSPGKRPTRKFQCASPFLPQQWSVLRTHIGDETRPLVGRNMVNLCLVGLHGAETRVGGLSAHHDQSENRQGCQDQDGFKGSELHDALRFLPR